MRFPVTVHMKRPDGSIKTLNARDEAELKALIRIGWSVTKPE